MTADKKEKKEFLEKFLESETIAAFKKLCSEVLIKSRCLFFDSRFVLLKSRAQCIAKSLIKLKSHALKEPLIVKCSCCKICLFVPIVQGNNIYGYILFMHLPHEPNKKIIRIIEFVIELALKEFQKEQELIKLYDTIRPRAIALSTIHTIHRLLSSTLNMGELIERIARLTLQVMRSSYCAIMLIDNSKKYLIPTAVIDLKNNGGRVNKKCRKIKIGTGIEGRTAKTGKINFSKTSICVPLISEDIIGVITTRNKTNKAGFTKFELEILLTLAEQAVIAIKNAQLYEEQEKMAYGSIKSLSAILDAKSPNTYTHSDQFVNLVLAISEEMKLAREDIINLHYAALLPDTGKFSIPEEILRKPGLLSKKEYNIIKRQHLEGLKIIEPLKFLASAMPIIRHHHEKYDGTGYPDGLKGEDIPLGARIMAVADAFEAMVSSRPYKGKRISIGHAIKEIERNKGRQFDPDVVEAFINITKKQDFKESISRNECGAISQ